MVNLKPLFTQAKNGLNKWRIAFIVFAAIYAVILLLDLSKAAIQWDEINHLNGGSFLIRGEFDAYIGFNSFYPPMFDAITFVFFKVLGVSVFSGRFVAVVFSLLCLWVIFEFTNKMYNAKTALLSSVLLGIMPGYLWLSRMAMIETMLVFFFLLTAMFFFFWLKDRRNKWLFLSGLALGLGFLTKYQMIIAGVIMLASILFLARDRFKLNLSKFTIIILIVIAVAIPWILITYQTYASNMLNEWMYALQMGNPEKSVYSTRFSVPVSYTIFYFIEMVWPYSDVHPISLLLYIVSLIGLGLFSWRRKPEDKYLLIWFTAVFVFFTLIPNKHWRYVLPLFPVLAISAASLIVFIYDKMQQVSKGFFSKKRKIQVAAVLFTAFLAAGAFFSASDAYSWVTKDQIQIPVEEATNYMASRLGENESIMIVCPFNLFSQDMFRFYLWADGSKRSNQVIQYPALPIDTFAPDFNITEFVGLCEEYKVKYIVLYDHGAYTPFYGTNLTISDVTTMLYETGRFGDPLDNPFFGTMPHRLFPVRFLRNQTNEP